MRERPMDQAVVENRKRARQGLPPLALEEVIAAHALRNKVQRESAQEVARAKLQLEVAKRRLHKLAEMVWETRWATDEEDYQHMVGVAAEIRSGNMKGIDAEIAKESRR